MPDNRAQAGNHGLLSPILVFFLLHFFLVLAGCGADKGPGQESAESLLPEPDDVIPMTGLQNPVHVLVDNYGIPHIYGNREEDVLIVQGYMHARDRFTEIDIFRHAASGRIAEITGQMPGIGPLVGSLTALTVDRLIRSLFTTSNGNRIASEILETASPDLHRTINSFCAGVNAYIRDMRQGRNDAQLAPYYKQFFGVSEDRVPDYTPEDLVHLGLFMAFFLAGMDDLVEDITNAAYFQYVDEDILFDTIRSAPSAPVTVLPYPWGKRNDRQENLQSATPVSTNPETAKVPEIPEETLAKAGELFRLLGALMGQPQERYSFGSNNWTVAADSTARGYAIMANDQHLAFLNPPIYYQSHINTKRFGGNGLNVIGVSFAGFPGISSGHNEFVGWGQTVMGYDQADIFVETVVKEEGGFPESVLFQGESVPTRTVMETFQIGYGPGARELQLPIVYTPQHGPILPYSTRRGTALSVKWVGQYPFLDSEGLYLIDRARDVFEFGEALKNFHAAAFHWVFADIHGNIGYSGHARIPVRQNIGQFPPFRPLPGTGEAEWNGFVGEEDLPLAFNPAEGFFNTSNNDIFGTTMDNDPFNDPVYYFFNCDIGFRAQRIRDLLSDRISNNGISFEDMKTLQADTYSFAAERLLPFLFEAAQALPERITPVMEAALERLSSWNYTSPTGIDTFYRLQPPVAEEESESIASSIFHAWLNRLLTDTFRDDYQAHRQQEPPGVEMTTKAMIHLLEHPEEAHTGQELFDDRSSPDHVETPHEMLLGSLDRATNFLRGFFGTGDMNAWQWGKLHQTSFLLGYEDISLPLFPIQGPFPKSGASFTVDASDFGSNPESFHTTFGANTRFIIEMEPGVVRAVNAQPGGQSERPEDPHYADLTEIWLDNRYHELHFWLEDVLEHTETYLKFVPE